MEKMLRVTASDFCAGAVFEDNEDFHFICTKAAPKLGALLNMDLEKATRRCKMMGWETEETVIVPEVRFLFDWNQLDKGTGPIRGRLVQMSDPEHRALLGQT